jgi:hypothetical protein
MKISQDTLTVLKNFSTINSNLIVRPGNTLTTISPTKNILGEAKVKEDFPNEFGIWDLGKFLATVSMFKDPSFEFENNRIVIYSEGSRAKVRYYYSSLEMLDAQMLSIAKTGKRFSMPASVVDFRLDSKDFTELQKAAAVLGAPDLALRNADGRLTLNVFDRKDLSGHTYSIDVGEYAGDDSFEFLFKTENLRMIPGSYEVSISDKKVSQFQTKSKDLTYWISLEVDSKYAAANKKKTHATAS